MVFLSQMPDFMAIRLAEILHVDVATVRLLMTLVSGYPVACLYNVKSPTWSVQTKHLYLLLCGVLLYYWNFGPTIIHALVAISATIFMNTFSPSQTLAVVFAFTFHLTYLLAGCYVYNRGIYDINWTMPHCVLCLRLIGLTWDLYDGSRSSAGLSATQKKSAIHKRPGLLETFSFCFVPTAFITGPQFPMRHYQSFIEGSLRPALLIRQRTFSQKFVTNPKVYRTILRFTTGMIGIGVLSKLLTVFPAELMLGQDFQQNWNFFSRFTYMAVFVQLTLLRYISVWLVGEGSSVLLGLGCTGYIRRRRAKMDVPDGNAVKENIADGGTGDILRKTAVLDRRGSVVDWTELQDSSEQLNPAEWEICEAEHTACANVSLARFLLATSTDDLVAGFNINTNRWMLEYVYKRLRFLGNKNLSTILTLLFLATWHGTHSGYYINFAMEFIILAVEKDLLKIVHRSVYQHFFYFTTSGFITRCVLGKLHTIFLLTFPLLAFNLLKFGRYFPVYKSVYFVGFVYLLWPLLRPVVKLLFPAAKTQTTSNNNVCDSAPGDDQSPLKKEQ